MIHPKVYIPNHWDGLFNPFWTGLPFPYQDDALAAFLTAQGIPLMPQHQYFDGYRITPSGITTLDNAPIKQKLGFAAVQSFSAARVAAARAVARTVSGEDCDN